MLILFILINILNKNAMLPQFVINIQVKKPGNTLIFNYLFTDETKKIKIIPN